MIKTILTALVVAGTLPFTVQAQTTPAGTPAQASSQPRKTAQANSGNLAPNRSSTAGVPNAQTSNNPVDATGKPVGTTEANNTSTVKGQKRKK
ncbi:MAG: hypothetical protein EOO62_02265 [Hymenobacter sp.]|nr:MAG: hypothetical protein EOO62_02265 [Hymenobacter sp.]